MLARGNANQANAQPSQGGGPFPSPTTEVTTAPGSSVAVSESALPDGAATDASVLLVQSAVESLATTAVTLVHTSITTGASSAPALAANPNAKYRLFQNIDPTNAISIAFGVDAVANTQIVLFPKDRIDFALEDGNLDRRVVNCIAVAGTPVLLVTEG